MTAMAGFSLVELMLSLSLGLALSGVMLQGLMAAGQTSQRLTRLWRERAWQRRTLELVKSDLLQATAVSASPELEPHACSLAGRTPVLQMSTPAGPITYSVGAAPSAIWRGQVLMRCGPAYGLEGSLSIGSQAQNRVVIDGLSDPASSSAVCMISIPSMPEESLNSANDSTFVRSSDVCIGRSELIIHVCLAPVSSQETLCASAVLP